MKTNIITFIASIALLSSCGGNRQKAITEDTVKVKVMTVGSVGSVATQAYSGSIETGRVSELSLTNGGTLTQVVVEEGMPVSKGQLIAISDQRLASDNLHMAMIQLSQAHDTYDRAKKMYESKSMPESEWIEAKNNLRHAEIQVDAARKQLEDCRITAPFSGYVVERDAQSGQNVSAGMTIVKVADISHVKASVNIPSTERNKYRVGQHIAIRVADLGNRIFNGIVSEIGIDADPTTRTYNIKATVDNANDLLLPGMICMIAGKNVSIPSSVVIPENLVQFDAYNNHYVWTVGNGRAARRPITIGDVSANGVTVTNGLSQGDKIVCEGQQKLYQGVKVSEK